VPPTMLALSPLLASACRTLFPRACRPPHSSACTRATAMLISCTQSSPSAAKPPACRASASISLAVSGALGLHNTHLYQTLCCRAISPVTHMCTTRRARMIR